MAWTVLRVGGIGENYGNAHKEFMVESSTDLDDIDLNGVAPGSTAHTAGRGSEWELGLDGSWALVGEEVK